MSELRRRTVVDLFAGGGGSHMGWDLAGFDSRLAVEWEDHAAACFRLNFPEVPLYHGDVGELSGEEALRLAGVEPGELDVLSGSPPCQSFSTAGSRMLSDSRTELFQEFVRLLRVFRPRAFVMENVPGIALGKMKLVFLEVMAALRASGYRVRMAVLDASAYGVPQRRKRAIFVGVREDLGVEPAFPELTHARAVTVAEALGASAMWQLGTPRKAARELDVDGPSLVVCKTAGGYGDTYGGPVAVGYGAREPDPLAAGPAPAVMSRAFGAGPAPSPMLDGVGGSARGRVQVAVPAPAGTLEGVLFPSSGPSETFRRLEPLALADGPSPTLMHGGVGGSAMGQVQVAVQGGASPMSDVLPAPPLTGKALEMAERLTAGQRGTQGVDGFRAQYHVKLDPAAPSPAVAATGALSEGPLMSVEALLPAPPLTGKVLEIALLLREGQDAASLPMTEGSFFGHHRLSADAPAPTVTKGSGLFNRYPNVRHFAQVRGLSVGEVMRLQSFPDDYQWPAGTTWATGWARVGNSVPPKMMRAVADRVRALLDEVDAKLLAAGQGVGDEDRP